MQLSPIGWALRPLKRYAEFSGRSSRAEFWWFTLFYLVFYFVLLIIGFSVSGSSPTANAGASPFAMYMGMGGFLVVIVIFWLAIIIPSIAVQIRRLHDTNRSGWWLGGFWLLYIIYMVLTFSMVASVGQTPGSPPNMGGFAAVGIVAIAFFGYSIMLLVFWCLRGTPGPNRFGNDPYGADVEEVFA